MKFWQRKTEANDLRNYLLGTFPESEREKLEQRVLTEAAVYEELLTTEDELVDQYLTNQLSEAERKQFESHFSASQDHQQKIRFGRTFRTYIESNVGQP